jgi:formylglycine-generating enzyme required for sulfatase activity
MHAPLLLLLVLMSALTLAATGAPARDEAATPTADQPRAGEPNRLGQQFIRIPAGSYERGAGRWGNHRFDKNHRHSNDPYTGRESPEHRVNITRPFELARTEVTVGQFRRFVEATGYVTDAEKHGTALGHFPEADNWVDRFRQDPAFTWRAPGFDQNERHPVVCVSWRDARAFCQWLSKTEGATYRLPTEAEWEYACRAGQQYWYSWGPSPDDAYAHANVADAALEQRHPGMASYQRAVRLEPGQGDGVAFTAPVGSYTMNPWGLFDMHGNVWEWCGDRWSGDTYRLQLEGLNRRERMREGLDDPFFDTKTSQHQYGDWRVMRGGAWTCAPANVRASIRTYLEAGDAAVYTGFRVVREIAGP